MDEASKIEKSLRTSFALNLLWAGVPGAVAVFAPKLAEKIVWPMVRGGSEPASPKMDRMMGQIWLSIGVLSLLGLRDPKKYAAVIPLQVAYKAAWAATVGLPAIKRGEKALIPMTASFALIAATHAALFPVKDFFSSEGLLSAGSTAARS
jgi:hypothetical protein